MYAERLRDCNNLGIKNDGASSRVRKLGEIWEKWISFSRPGKSSCFHFRFLTFCLTSLCLCGTIWKLCPKHKNHRPTVVNSAVATSVFNDGAKTFLAWQSWKRWDCMLASLYVTSVMSRTNFVLLKLSDMLPRHPIKPEKQRGAHLLWMSSRNRMRGFHIKLEATNKRKEVS